MPAERDLRRLLAGLEPVRRPGTFVFAVLPDEARLADVAPEATVREPEGLSVVVRRERARALGLSYSFEAAWITLRVHSALEAVGLTSAVARTLAGADLPCNVIAGVHHDHLLVPVDRGEEAVALLRELARVQPAARTGALRPGAVTAGGAGGPRPPRSGAGRTSR